MSSSDDIFRAVQSLAPTERWQLVSRLWAALPPEAYEAHEGIDLDEIQRRSASFDAGGVETINRDEIRQRIRDQLNRHG